MDRLIAKMKAHIKANGWSGMADIIKAADRGQRSVEGWIAETSPVPSDLDTRRDIALACGCPDGEALEIAQESPEAKGKAS